MSEPRTPDATRQGPTSAPRCSRSLSAPGVVIALCFCRLSRRKIGNKFQHTYFKWPVASLEGTGGADRPGWHHPGGDTLMKI